MLLDEVEHLLQRVCSDATVRVDELNSFLRLANVDWRTLNCGTQRDENRDQTSAHVFNRVVDDHSRVDLGGRGIEESTKCCMRVSRNRVIRQPSIVSEDLAYIGECLLLGSVEERRRWNAIYNDWIV